jgi:hypothetical protein
MELPGNSIRCVHICQGLDAFHRRDRLRYAGDHGDGAPTPSHETLRDPVCGLTAG